MLFREGIVVYFKNDTKPIKTHYVHTAELFIVNVDGIYSYVTDFTYSSTLGVGLEADNLIL
jgi:hypothetical protein